MEFFFLIENPEDYETIDLAATSHGVEEVELVEFIDPKQHVVLPDFLQKIDLKAYVDTIQPVLIHHEMSKD